MTLAEKILNRKCAPTETLKAMEQIAWEVWKHVTDQYEVHSLHEDVERKAFDEWYNKQQKEQEVVDICIGCIREHNKPIYLEHVSNPFISTKKCIDYAQKCSECKHDYFENNKQQQKE